MELRIAQSALEDLQAIQEHYFEEGVPHIGHEYVTAILEHAEMLVHHPDAGRIVPEFGLNHIRELIHSPFRVVYLRQEADVVLIRAWRSERQLELPR
ncbi:type II toxin-antitoxin system RelE/ParE family toxin [Marinobacter adhaerens]|uniref:Type II toxin-antitoxin system RelE/ParE family toxin n=1 Tax=Marinobacter adhaerens TaxID=1033846 RepID=A0A851HMP5_9GAMM|nr:type II toxin-antitoxin system RelE/ParE family toxin [Marinobacter adhaerens]NWN90293.1 type II toxin-antitoxin system RelE/ParE family toxin [Marinobacter adhaerens]